MITFLHAFDDIPYISSFPFSNIFYSLLKGAKDETELEMDI